MKYNEFAVIIQEMSRLYLCTNFLEKRCEYWSFEEYNNFKNDLLKIKLYLKEVNEKPEYILKYKLNQKINDFESYIFNLNLFVQKWENYINLFDKLKDFSGDVQDSLNIVKYLSSMKNLSEDQTQKMQKHNDILNNKVNYIMEFVKEECIKLNLNWEKIEKELHRKKHEVIVL